MKLSEAEQLLKNGLHGLYDQGEADAIISLAMEHLTGRTAAERKFGDECTLSSQSVEQLKSILQRLQQHEPIQYIMNKSWFYGLELYVDNNVLIPRPETEELVKWVIDDVKAGSSDVFEKKAVEADETTQLKILDVGTGSGCIA